MLSETENNRLSSAGLGTPGGALLRKYWQPVALVEELDDERPALCVTVLGETYVLFRDERGRYGLLDRHCPHRGADLSYGRLEDGGLRCVFHGWLFDVDGQCLEQPAEPPQSRLHERIVQAAYPCRAINGVIFSYLGADEAPALPELDCFTAPQSHSFAFKGLLQCNWMQALEVGIDPAHASYLHRFLCDEDTSAGYGRQFRSGTALTDIPLSQLLRDFPRPNIVVQNTLYGLRLVALRELNTESTHVRVTNLLFPHAIVIPMSDAMTITQWHVPIDDRSCYWYAMFTSFSEPVDRQQMRSQRLELYSLPDYAPRIGRHNNYGFDAHDQRTRTYTGMGDDINVHDQWAVESMGALQDRSKEHLAHSDVGIRAFRQQLTRAIDQCELNVGELICDHVDASLQPLAVDAIGASQDWETCWRTVEQLRRAATPWLQS